jgi:hypothetical protein
MERMGYTKDAKNVSMEDFVCFAIFVFQSIARRPCHAEQVFVCFAIFLIQSTG